MGLKNSPASFQRMINCALSGLNSLKCLVYLDDIIVYGDCLETHNSRLLEVFDRLRQHNLQLQPDKCEYFRKEVIYLGHKITENGVLPDPDKIEAVKSYPCPRDVESVQRFLGFAGYYRRFIRDFQKIAMPLTCLTSKKREFKWNLEAEKAFEILREKLINAPLLQYPKFDEDYIITTDASGKGLGAVLSQGEIGKDLPIAYASRKLNDAELKYSTIERELLGIKYGLKQFRQYVYGTKIKIVTDHKPLVHLHNLSDPSSRLMNWRLEMEEYDYEIMYKKGKENTNSDALSRIYSVVVDSSLSEDEAEALSPDDRLKILIENHSSVAAGHSGVKKTVEKIKLHYDWNGLARDVKKFVKKCEICQKFNLMRKNKAKMVITDTPLEALDKCYLDIVGPLPKTSKGNMYILTFQDGLSKFVQAIPIKVTDSKTVADKFVKHIVSCLGLPKVILSDQGSNFTSKLFKSICKIFGIEKVQTSAYHPQSNGALERYHAELKRYLRYFIDEDQSNWDEWVRLACFSYNTSVHSSSGFTPYEVMFGRKAEMPSALKQKNKPFYAYDDYVSELREKMRKTNQIAGENLIENKEKRKEIYDKNAKEPTFKVGDMVLLKSETVRQGRSKKLGPAMLGPYEVLEKISDVNFKIKMGRKEYVVHSNRINHFYS